MNEIEIKINYSTDNIAPAYEIRQKVFIDEQGFKNEFDEIDRIAWHCVVYYKNQPAATGRLFSKNYDTKKSKFSDEYTIGRICVLKQFRGLGLGEAVIVALEKKAKDLGGKEIYLSSQQQAYKFYEKLGFATMGDIYFDEHCPHILMIKKI